MKLIIGLGNPGKDYENTRHNIGFRYLDNYAENHNFLITKKKFNGLAYELTINNEKVIFLKPLSFMNLSGTVVRKYMDYYKIDIKDILVIHDDLDMPIAKIKVKLGGSSGGHNGIRNIIDNLNDEKFLRLKVGISNNKENVIDYVLGKFSKEDNEKLNKLNNKVNNIIDDFIYNKNINDIMAQYNGVNNENICQ